VIARKLFQIVALLALLASGHALAADTLKVVYHINEGVEKATVVLRNIRNHLAAEPGAKIVVVGHNAGIDFMLKGAQDKNGNPFDAAMDELSLQGVEFRVCRNTLTGRSIPEANVAKPATIVPSGVAEVARLQAKEGYVYLKP
jgi:hypothetical protein